MSAKIMRVATASMLTGIFSVSLAGPVFASERGDLSHAAKSLRHKVVVRHGQKTAGRDIIRDGVVFINSAHDEATRRPKLAELRKYKNQLAKILRPVPSYLKRTVGPPAQAPAGVQTAGEVSRGGSSNGMVNPNCESGGDPTAVDPSGQYRGKYQFDRQTWERFGGTGDPAAASEAEQDRVAARVTYDAWPNC